MIPYGKQTIDASDVRSVVRALKSAWLTQGPGVASFEKALCQKTGARYAVAVANGTAALHLGCLAIGLTKGDEVITSPLTFAASANCARYCDATVVFADIDPVTGNIDPKAIARKITRRTKMIIPVHYAGNSCDMQAIRRIVKSQAHRIWVMEDAAHALGAQYKKQSVGQCGQSDMAILSFHPLKHITTAEGGAILTNNKDLYHKLLRLRTHGITKDPKQMTRRHEGGWYHEMQELGFNYRISDLQCALGVSQIEKLDTFVAKRRAIAKVYDKAFAGNPYFDVPHESTYGQMSYHLYPIRLKQAYASKRRAIFERLQTQGIGVQVHYIPVYWHPYYESLGYRRGLCPFAEQFYASEISLPMYPSLTRKEQSAVIQALQSAFAS